MSIMELDKGVQGAKRQTMKKNARPLVVAVLDARPRGVRLNDASLFRDFKKRLRASHDYDELLESIVHYYFANEVKNLTKKKPTAAEKAAIAKAREQLRERTKQAALMKIEAAKGIMFLETVLPNGKMLKDCTRSQLEVMGDKMGAVVAGICRSLKKPNQRVGSVFKSNEEIAERFLR